MAHAFSLGDIVVLKSGGPAMTIDKIVPAQYGDPLKYYCRWFKGATAEGGSYTEHSLELFKKPTPLTPSTTASTTTS